MIRKRTAACAAAVVLVLQTLVLVSPAAATINTGASALTIAQSMVSNTSVIPSAAFVTGGGSPATALSTTALTGFPTAGGSYAMLTTGDASLASQPNSAPNSGADLGGPNVRGDTDFDVTVLRVDLNVPAGTNCLTGFDFRFLSEEFPEFVNTEFNDAFVAELDASTWTTSGSEINAPDNFAFDPSGNPITINAAGTTSMSAADAAGTTYDGATPLLTAATPISPGSHALFLSIFDQGDHNFDSAVFLDNLRFGTVADVETQCVPGAEPVGSTTTGTIPPSGGIVSSPKLGNGVTQRVKVKAKRGTPGGEVVIQIPDPNPEPCPYVCYGVPMHVTAFDTGSASNPLILTFIFARGVFPTNLPLSRIHMFRNEVNVKACTGPAGKAIPDPCIKSVTRGSGGAITVVALSSDETDPRWRGH